jgi:hypothetical protein
MALTAAEPAGVEEGELVTDAAVIRLSWESPAQFGVIYHRYAAAIHRYLGRRAGVQLACPVNTPHNQSPSRNAIRESGAL